MNPYNDYQQAPSQEHANIPYDLLMKIPTDQMIKLIPCKVCGDRSSGVHYGVITCEGCKGFYRRAMEEKVDVSCGNNDHRGPITKENRNRCKQCRLRACRIVGMNIETRVFGRMSRKGKENIIREVLQHQPGMLPALINEAHRIMSNNIGRSRVNENYEAPVEYVEMHQQTFQHQQSPPLLFHPSQQQIPHEMLPEAEAVTLSPHNPNVF